MEKAVNELPSKILRVGDCVRIGRNSTCEVTIQCPNISSLHCEIEVIAGEDDGGPGELSREGPSFFVRDHSSNGTWIQRRVKEAGSESVVKDPKVVKLSKGSRESLRPGDLILLLAPTHKACGRYRLALHEGTSEGEYVVRQLPLKAKTNGNVNKPGMKVKTKAATPNITTASDPVKVSSPQPSTSGKGSSGSSKLPEKVAAEKSDDSIPPGGTCKRKLETAASDVDASSTEVKKIKTDGESETVRDKIKDTAESVPCPKETVTLPSTSPTAPFLSREASQESCPICSKLFPVTELAAHSGECQILLGVNPDRVDDEALKLPVGRTSTVTLSSPSAGDADIATEHCPGCLKLFPLSELIAHSESCTHCTTPPSMSDSIKPAVAKDVSMEQCPNCFKLFPVAVLIAHSEECMKTSRPAVTGSGGVSAAVSSKAPYDAADETDGGRRGYDLETYSPAREAAAGVERREGDSELEQCMYCLRDFPVLELMAHVGKCPMKDAAKCTVEEHCQHCLQIFPLDQLVSHALSCPHRKDLSTLASGVEEGGVVGSQDVWGEPVERCMHCFRDFPLSALVEHSLKCTGDMLGSRDRFKGFLPSIHDLDPMALAVLNDTQNAAVEYVIKKSKASSDKVHSALLKKVCRLGYTEDDMERILQWIRREAPIIIHLNLDRVLHFLVEDTHYRNQFETSTSGGSTCLSARTSWEDRMFNNIYRRSAPVDRVKYGVLNIVGDPRGVRSCYGYGDSFLQLKKVRLRTTFASADTSMSAVKLSCCEYYGNVLHEYSDNELRAILDVSTRKKNFLRSDVISVYKEVQIHGPVCLSENVECIVVNDRHAKDPHIGSLLEKFLERNKCNLIWMEPDAEMRYPVFGDGVMRGGATTTGGAGTLMRRDYYYEAYGEYEDEDDCTDDYSDSDEYYSEEGDYYGMPAPPIPSYHPPDRSVYYYEAEDEDDYSDSDDYSEEEDYYGY